MNNRTVGDPDEVRATILSESPAGVHDIPEITSTPIVHSPAISFKLDTVEAGDSEMQHLDYAYTMSLVRTFVDDDSLILTIRGRKRTPHFSFHVGKHQLDVEGVQTEVDGGYEGRGHVVLIEAKNSNTTNTIIRQLFYPFRQWSMTTKKPIIPIFFEKRGSMYSFWQFNFSDPEDYNSISLARSVRYHVSDRRP